MGLTRHQIYIRDRENARKYREYHSIMTPIWEERRIAIGMLLDAIWDPKLGFFRRLHRMDKWGAWFRCWDEQGREIEARMLKIGQA